MGIVNKYVAISFYFDLLRHRLGFRRKWSVRWFGKEKMHKKVKILKILMRVDDNEKDDDGETLTDDSIDYDWNTSMLNDEKREEKRHDYGEQRTWEN